MNSFFCGTPRHASALGKSVEVPELVPEFRVENIKLSLQVTVDPRKKYVIGQIVVMYHIMFLLMSPFMKHCKNVKTSGDYLTT